MGTPVRTTVRVSKESKGSGVQKNYPLLDDGQQTGSGRNGWWDCWRARWGCCCHLGHQRAEVEHPSVAHGRPTKQWSPCSQGHRLSLRPGWIIENIGTSDVVQQTQETLVKIEKLLADVGTNKSNILEARIWLKDIKRDFAAMNGVWNNWVDQENKGVRYCVESNLARENLLVEIQIVATI